MGEDFKTIIHVYYQYVIFLLNDNKSISDRHMKVVTKRLYGYTDTNTINKGKNSCNNNISKMFKKGQFRATSACDFYTPV